MHSRRSPQQITPRAMSLSPVARAHVPPMLTGLAISAIGIVHFDRRAAAHHPGAFGTKLGAHPSHLCPMNTWHPDRPRRGTRRFSVGVRPTARATAFENSRACRTVTVFSSVAHKRQMLEVTAGRDVRRNRNKYMKAGAEASKTAHRARMPAGTHGRREVPDNGGGVVCLRTA